MRIGEAVALMVGDLDVDRQAIVVARSLEDDGSLGSTKSDRFRRVEIGPHLTARLADHASQRLEQTDDVPQRVAMFVSPLRVARTDPGRWSTKEQLGLLDRSAVSMGWHKETLKAAGLRDMPLHALRHTASAAWLSTGRPLMYVQRQLGHAQITTTEGLYGHLDQAFNQHAAADTERRIREAARSGTRWT